jgi:hypothetical protein
MNTPDIVKKAAKASGSSTPGGFCLGRSGPPVPEQASFAADLAVPLLQAMDPASGQQTALGMLPDSGFSLIGPGSPPGPGPVAAASMLGFGTPERVAGEHTMSPIAKKLQLQA